MDREGNLLIGFLFFFSVNCRNDRKDTAVEQRDLRRRRRVRQHSAALRSVSGWSRDRHRQQLTPPVAPVAVAVSWKPPDINSGSPGSRPVLSLPAGQQRGVPHSRRRVHGQQESRGPLDRQVPGVRRPSRRPRENISPRRRRPEEAGDRGIRRQRQAEV